MIGKTKALLAAAVTMVASAAFPSAAFAADEPTVLQPSSAWNLDYAEDSCRIGRIFGDGDSKTVLYLERYHPGDSFDLVVAGAPFKGMDDIRSREMFSFRFGPEEAGYESYPALGNFGEYSPAVVLTSAVFARDQDAVTAGEEKWRRPDPDDIPQDFEPFERNFSPEREAQIEWLEVSRGERPPVRLAIGSMDAPMKAMRECIDELLTHWGIDVAAHANLTRPVSPKNNPASWITHNDYPTRLVRRGDQGVVHFRLSVDADGKPTQCHIQRSTRPAEFDEIVCKALMRRARFIPAMDADRQPIASYFRSTVRFQIPQ